MRSGLTTSRMLVRSGSESSSLRLETIGTITNDYDGRGVTRRGDLTRLVERVFDEGGRYRDEHDSADLNDEFDLDGRIQREYGHSDGAARMFASVAKGCTE